VEGGATEFGSNKRKTMISLLNRQKSSAIEHAALNPQIRTLIIAEADSPFAVEYITPVSCHPSCLD